MSQVIHLTIEQPRTNFFLSRKSRTVAKLGTPRFKPVVTREVWSLPSDSVSLESSVTMEKSGELILG